MPRSAQTDLDLGLTVNQAASDVQAQRALIASMRFDDPRLRDAFALLKQSEMRLTLAELDSVFVQLRGEGLPA